MPISLNLPDQLLARLDGERRPRESRSAQVARLLTAALDAGKAIRIIDDAGRIGDVTEDRGHGLFAKPAGVPYRVDAAEKVGMPGELITATFWHRAKDGSLEGSWYDSPPHTRHKAWIVESRS